MIDWTLIVQIAGIALSLIGGAASVPLVNWLKDALGVTGRGAQALTAVVAVVIAVLALIVSGAIAPDPLTADYVISLFTAVLVASQAEYQRLKNAAAPDDEELIVP